MISGYSSTMESVAAYSAAGIQNKKTTQNQKSAEGTDNTQTSGKTQNSGKSSATSETDSKRKATNVSGRTIGTPRLSDKAAKYYEQLKSKYSNMDFILVSEDQKEAAKAQAGNYANAFKMVVLIDEDKIERMASDESYRKQYEGIIANSASGLSQLKSSIEKTGADVKGFGMQVNDGGTSSFFAVLKKSSADQKARIEKKRESAKAEKKAAEKKAEKKAAEKKKEEKLKASKEENVRDTGEIDDDDSDTITITASSMEELIKKISDYVQNEKLGSVRTPQEKLVGQNFDASL